MSAETIEGYTFPSNSMELEYHSQHLIDSDMVSPELIETDQSEYDQVMMALEQDSRASADYPEVEMTDDYEDVIQPDTTERNSNRLSPIIDPASATALPQPSPPQSTSEGWRVGVPNPTEVDSDPAEFDLAQQENPSEVPSGPTHEPTEQGLTTTSEVTSQTFLPTEKLSSDMSPSQSLLPTDPFPTVTSEPAVVASAHHSPEAPNEAPLSPLKSTDEPASLVVQDSSGPQWQADLSTALLEELPFDDYDFESRPKARVDLLDLVPVDFGTSACPQVALETPTDGRQVPGVRLLCEGCEYSLFRQIECLPSDGGEQQASSADQTILLSEPEYRDLYYGPVEAFIQSLHNVFPAKNDDDECDEFVLNFLELELKLPEDNTYTREISLYDFDRLHIGARLPGRLLISLENQPRFVSRFNSLAAYVSTLGEGTLEETVAEADPDSQLDPNACAETLLSAAPYDSQEATHHHQEPPICDSSSVPVPPDGTLGDDVTQDKLSSSTLSNEHSDLLASVECSKDADDVTAAEEEPHVGRLANSPTHSSCISSPDEAGPPVQPQHDLEQQLRRQDCAAEALSTTAFISMGGETNDGAGYPTSLAAAQCIRPSTAPASPDPAAEPVKRPPSVISEGHLRDTTATLINLIQGTNSHDSQSCTSIGSAATSIGSQSGVEDTQDGLHEGLGPSSTSTDDGVCGSGADNSSCTVCSESVSHIIDEVDISPSEVDVTLGSLETKPMAVPTLVSHPITCTADSPGSKRSWQDEVMPISVVPSAIQPLTSRVVNCESKRLKR